MGHVLVVFFAIVSFVLAVIVDFVCLLVSLLLPDILVRFAPSQDDLQL